MTMEKWLSEELSKALEFQVPEDLIQYIIAIDTEAEFNEYMMTLLDVGNVKQRDFFKELAKRKFPRTGNSQQSQAKKEKKKISKSKPQEDFVNVEKTTPPLEKMEPETDGKSKKKAKYVNLYSQEGEKAQVVLLKGRHACDCEASQHELINNCTECGRIVCAQEGSGPCLFCGSLVCTPEEEIEINSKTTGGNKLMASLKSRSKPKGWEEAIAHRDRLLDYDRHGEQRTGITDDDSDYFNTNSVWLSESERKRLDKYQEELQQKKHASKLSKKMTFDFAGRQIVEDTTIEHDVDESVIREITSGAGAASNANHVFLNDLCDVTAADRDVAPGVNAQVLQFNEAVKSKVVATVKSSGAANLSRIQDGAIQEMSDAGRCLSMHQPWASLLVEGVKMHEGRSWFSNHRGRLWIASTAKPADPDVVKALEDQYRALYPDKNIEFPSFYPSGCLLGCVNVDDCLPQEEYRKIYPDGESDSPYVFICSNPISLRLRFPITGQHKIYSLDKTIHTAALKSIQNMNKSQVEPNAG